MRARANRSQTFGNEAMSSQNRLRQPILGLVIWSLAGVIVLLVMDGSDARGQLLVFSSLSTIAGLSGFLFLGGKVINGPSVYSLGHCLIVGYGGIHIARFGFQDNDYDQLLRAAILLYGVMILLQHVFWYQWREYTPQRATPSSSVAIPGLLLSMLGTFGMTRVGRGGDYSVSTEYLLAEGAQLSGFVVLTAWAALTFRSVFPAYLVGGSLVVISVMSHSGGGRLRIAVFACAVACVITALHKTWWTKILATAATPLVLIVFARERAGDSGVGGSRTGLESLISPLHAVSKLMQARDQGELPERMGATFLTPIQVVIPGFMPTVRPFGYEIPKWTRPHIVSDEFSDAGHAVGEFLYNFGLLGVPLVVLVMGMLLPWISELPLRFQGSWQVFAFVTWALVVGTVLEYEWNGFHAASLRLATRVMGVAVILMFALLMRRKGRVDQSLDPAKVAGDNLWQERRRYGVSRTQ